MSPPTSAALPAAKYARPSLVDDSVRQVKFVDPDGRSKVFDFTDVSAAPTLLDDLIRAFASGVAPGGRWQSVATAEAAAGTVKHLARYLAEFHPGVVSLADLNAEVWWAWRSEKDKHTRWPGQVTMMRALLSEAPTLPQSTRRAMRAKAVKPRKRLPANDAYTREEFTAIRTAANHRVNQALRRIEANTAVLQHYLDGDEPADAPSFQVQGARWTVGSLLTHLSRTGMLPSQYLAWAVSRRGCFDLHGVTTPAHALFPSIDEVLNLMVLLVCERGFNLSVMNTLTVDSFRASDPDTEEPVHTVGVDKPRRGTRRYSNEILAGEAGKLWERAVTLTQPCRDARNAMGRPTDKLLVAHRHKNLTSDGPFRTEWTTACLGTSSASRTADGPTWTFRRLRLTEQVLNQTARQNTETESEDIYRRPDPLTTEAASETITAGLNDAVAHAHASIHVRAMNAGGVEQARQNPKAAAATLDVPVHTLELLLAGRLDTPTTACVDFFGSPFAADDGQPCPASFLACFACGNAVITPRHLPRLVVLLDALDDMATVVTPTRWDRDFAEHYARLRTVLTTKATTAEIVQARGTACDEDRDMVRRLLSRRLDG
ncbi:hypothetical protein [Rhodococcus coprophilus]|uniref:Uncharacterized protein n=1 Tax=Rhodococcus coprophilus TaxID=38310 RepID=A0A2X4U2S6_9NOCA|nr:hypothetical protein [Rhodococcus coprophilus]MBM7460765.1 hypothetical protein [Rhodococcus coprophilus]SQI28572.1 Uncharacterised protein [Rhodococcus coprophilus]